MYVCCFHGTSDGRVVGSFSGGYFSSSGWNVSQLIVLLVLSKVKNDMVMKNLHHFILSSWLTFGESDLGASWCQQSSTAAYSL
jgi:hypothetical protein